MKVFVVSILFAVLSGAACSAVAWPGAVPLSAGSVPLLRSLGVQLSAGAVPLSAGAVPLSASYVQSVIPPQVKAFGYSTSQYINSAPSLAIGYQPQVSYQNYRIPVSHYYPQQLHTYQPIVAPAYYPSTSLLYPTLAPAPVAPISAPVAQQPQAEAPSYPTRGDEDTAIVDSAEFPQQSFEPQPQAPENEYLRPQNNQPQAPENGYLPPQNNQPQEPTPSYPSPSPPSLPQIFPAADNNDQGLNDEDTISVESA